MNGAGGWNVTLVSTVENNGNGEGYYRAELYVDGAHNGDTQFVYIPPGESRQVSFTEQFASSGVYELGMAGGEMETVALGDAQVTTDTPTPTATPEATTDTPTATATLTEPVTSESDSGDSVQSTSTPVSSDVAVGSGPGFTVGTVLVAVAILTLALWIRRR